MPANFESMGTPCFSRTPLTTMLHTVARPIFPSGTMTSPRRSPAAATATRLLTTKPAAKTGAMIRRAFGKSVFLNREMFTGSSPACFSGSKVV